MALAIQSHVQASSPSSALLVVASRAARVRSLTATTSVRLCTSLNRLAFRASLVAQRATSGICPLRQQGKRVWSFVALPTAHAAVRRDIQSRPLADRLLRLTQRAEKRARRDRALSHCQSCVSCFARVFVLSSLTRCRESSSNRNPKSSLTRYLTELCHSESPLSLHSARW